MPVSAADLDRSSARPAGGLILPAAQILHQGALRARLAGAVEDASEASALRRHVVDILRHARETGADAIEKALCARPLAGREAARSYCWLTDRIVLPVVGIAISRLHPLPNPTKSQHLSVLSTGGYGRGEMAPFSDIDLLFLIPYKQTAWGESVIESVLYMLWDLHFKVGHAMRSVDDCLRLAGEDITIRTSLLERRYLAGDAELAEELETRLWDELFSRTGSDFVEAKLAERDARHERHGGSRYLLEPNIKEGKGGLRDLQTLYWIAKYLHRASSTPELIEREVLNPSEQELFSEAENFLWSVRCHLHQLTGRASEKLAFDLQVELAERMGFAPSGGRRAVENFMQSYFTQAKRVGELTRIFCAVLEARHVKSRSPIGPRLRRALGLGRVALAQNLVQRDGRLDFADAALLAETPLLILRLFQEQVRTGLRIHPDAIRLVAAQKDHLASQRGREQANEIFLDLLLGQANPERTLRLMNETGALSAFLPEFGEIECLMQFNMYHHYTVDEHTIRCISVLSQIERGELLEELPIASSILKSQIDRKALYIALLLHDIGKGQERDHSELGAEIAGTVCKRLGVDAGTTGMVVWLVRHHLLMSDVAQKRDIGDPGAVTGFARIVQSTERLKLLCVLTVCDITGVGPQVWNNWKAQLLRQLYRATWAELTGGADEMSRGEREGAAKLAFAEAFGRDAGPEAVAAEMARHYPTYWLGLDTDTQLAFARMHDDVVPGQILSRINPDPGRDATKAMFYLEDHPGIFSRVAGALALAGANVVDARTYTTRDAFATSVFWIQDRNGKPYEKSRLDKLRRSVEGTLKGEWVAREQFRTRDRLKRRERDFTVPTRIAFDNEGSDIFTIIEVTARDRPGLLHDLTRALAAASISISSAVIVTYGEEAVDVFYVKDLFGLKIHSQTKRKGIEARLRAAIDGQRQHE